MKLIAQNLSFPKILLDYCKLVITMCMIIVNRNLQSHKYLKMVTQKSKFALNMHFLKSKHVMIIVDNVVIGSSFVIVIKR